MPDLKGRPMRFSNLIRKVFVGAALALVPAASFAGVFVSVTIAPPVLPVYTQPLCPGEGYLWTPGSWAYGDEGYYWVPGVWVRPPQVGMLRLRGKTILAPQSNNRTICRWHMRIAVTLPR